MTWWAVLVLVPLALVLAGLAQGLLRGTGLLYFAPAWGDLGPVKLVRVIDGDTFVVDVSLEGLEDALPKAAELLLCGLPVRVAGIDAPELCEPGGEEARKALLGILRGAKLVELRRPRRGKYFRLVADAYVDGEPLADLMVASGHARPVGLGGRFRA